MGKRVYNRASPMADKKKVVVKSLVDSGMSYREVNEITGASIGSIKKICDAFETNQEMIGWYRKHRAGVLAQIQLENLALHRAVMGSITDTDIKNMTVSEKTRLAKDTAVNAGIFYDKEEIERSKGVDDINKALDVILKAREVLRGQS